MMYQEFGMKGIYDLDELTRITRRREFEDGLVDLLNAILYLVTGLLTASVYSPSIMLWYLRMLASYPEMTAVALVALVPLLALFLLISKHSIDRIRRHSLRLARGYVIPLHKVEWRTSIAALITVIVWASIGLWGTLSGRLPQESDLRLLVSGIGIAAGIVYLGKGLILDFPRYIVVGSAGGLLSIMITVFPFSFSTSWAVLGILWFTILLLSGLVGFHTTLQAIKRGDHV